MALMAVRAVPSFSWIATTCDAGPDIAVVCCEKRRRCALRETAWLWYVVVCLFCFMRVQ